MHTIGTWRHRGTSTILGTLIFIGILFTAVIPAYLVMRQADTLLEKRKLELERLDEERRSEDVYAYVNPKGLLEAELIVKVENKGNLAVRIVRVWINDEPHQRDVMVQPMSGQINLGSFIVTEQGEHYVTLTTDRGNVIAFDTPLTWNYTVGWKSDIFSINVLISSLPGTEFKIRVTGHEPDVMTEKFDPKFIIVDNPGTYTVTILRGSKPIYTEDVTISWPDGPPVAWVFA